MINDCPRISYKAKFHLQSKLKSELGEKELSGEKKFQLPTYSTVETSFHKVRFPLYFDGLMCFFPHDRTLLPGRGRGLERKCHISYQRFLLNLLSSFIAAVLYGNEWSSWICTTKGPTPD